MSTRGALRGCMGTPVSGRKERGDCKLGQTVHGRHRKNFQRRRYFSQLYHIQPSLARLILALVRLMAPSVWATSCRVSTHPQQVSDHFGSANDERDLDSLCRLGRQLHREEQEPLSWLSPAFGGRVDPSRPVARSSQRMVFMKVTARPHARANGSSAQSRSPPESGAERVQYWSRVPGRCGGRG